MSQFYSRKVYYPNTLMNVFIEPHRIWNEGDSLSASAVHQSLVMSDADGTLPETQAWLADHPPLPDACPACGGPVGETGVAHQYQTDIPRTPITRQFHVHLGECRRCGRRVQGRHPLQTSDALGAAAAQVGPDAQAAVVVLT